jgi:hypothetical protein
MLASRKPWRRTCARFGESRRIGAGTKKRKLPVLLTPNEVKRLLSFLKGVNRLFLSPVRNWNATHRGPAPAGQRRRLRLRITVRDGKGAKDRMTMLPASIKAELQERLQGVERKRE